MNILFIGDIFASAGRRIVADHLRDIVETNRIELAVANAENAAGGFGITPALAEELFARAALVDRGRLAGFQDACRLVEAEDCFRDAFWCDVRPLVQEWRVSKGLPPEPLAELRASGYVERIRHQRAERNEHSLTSYA